MPQKAGGTIIILSNEMELELEDFDALILAIVVTGLILGLLVLAEVRVQHRLRKSRSITDQIKDIRDGSLFENNELTKLLARIELDEQQGQTYREHPEWIPAVLDFNRRLEMLASSSDASLAATLKLAEESADFLRKHRLKGMMVSDQAHRLTALLKKRDGIGEAPGWSKKKRAFIVIGVMGSILAVVDVGWSLYRTSLARFYNKPGGPRPSNTIEEAKARGTFLTTLAFEPRSFESDEKQITVKECWLEKAAERTRTMVLIPILWEWPTYTIHQSYDVCFTPTLGKDMRFSVDGGIFILEATNAGLTHLYLNEGGTLLYCPVPNPDFKEISVLFKKEWKAQRSMRLKILNPNGA